ncbi:MAG: hypothetical protein WD077_05525 [Bacteroidia bacterium]
MEQALKILSVIALCSFKYLMGNGLAIVYGFDFFTALLSTVAGGVAGVIFFIYLGHQARKALAYFFPGLRNLRPAWSVPLSSKTGTGPESTKPEKPMSRKERWIQRIINNYGLAGIAILTPVLFTVPVGAFIAVALDFPRLRIVFYMAGSFFLWSLFMLGLASLTGIDVPSLYRDLEF